MDDRQDESDRLCPKGERSCFFDPTAAIYIWLSDAHLTRGEYQAVA